MCLESKGAGDGPAPQGRLLLQREYVLSAVDCPRAGALLASVLDRFFADLPAEDWPPPRKPDLDVPKPASPVLSPPARTTPWARLALIQQISPVTESVQLSAGAETSGDGVGFSGGAAVQYTGARKLGSGHYQAFSASLVGGFYRTGTPWGAGLEVQGGVSLAVGTGYHADFSTWMPLVGISALAWRELGPSRLGVAVGVNPVLSRIAVRDGPSETTAVFNFVLFGMWAGADTNEKE